MDRNMEPGAAALPKTGDGLAYPVVFGDDTSTHLTTNNAETLCNRQIKAGLVRAAASFDANACDTCRGMADARDLAIGVGV